MTECVDCALTIDSQQSGTLSILGRNVFATAELQGEIVYALGNAGPGRFIATADSSLAVQRAVRRPDPRMAGRQPRPEPQAVLVGLGRLRRSRQLELPRRFVGHPPAAAVRRQPGPARGRLRHRDVPRGLGPVRRRRGSRPTRRCRRCSSSSRVHGGGAYISSEFAGYLKPADYASVNRVLMPLGVEALEVNLNWGDVNGQIEFTCFPAPVG